MDSNIHKILQNQVENFLPEKLKNSEELRGFLNSVSQTYIDFESKIKNFQSATSDKSSELDEARRLMKLEHDRKEELIEDLQAALMVLEEDDERLINSDDPGALAKILVQLIAKHTQTEQQLKARTEEMELINRAMIGRELKMVELKKQIISLRRKLEEIKNKKEKTK